MTRRLDKATLEPAIRRLSAQGHYKAEIARMVGCSPPYVTKILGKGVGPHGSSIPTDGYPTRKAAIIGMHDRGMSHAEIAAKLGKTPQYIKGVLCEARRTLRNRRDAIIVHSLTLEKLKEAAEKRNLGLKELCVAMIEKIAQDDLADAIMGDAA